MLDAIGILNTELDMQVLRLQKVLEKTGDSRSGLYAKIAKNLFPKPIKLSTRQSGWLASEVDEWIQSRIVATRGDNKEQK